MSENGIAVTEINIPEQKVFEGQLFPLVLTPESESVVTADLACDWLKGQRAEISDKLVQFGAIFFRGFPLKDAQDFDKFVTAYGLEPLPYVGGAAPRRKITDKVSTANEVSMMFVRRFS